LRWVFLFLRRSSGIFGMSLGLSVRNLSSGEIFVVVVRCAILSSHDTPDPGRSSQKSIRRKCSGVRMSELDVRTFSGSW
jgi:hypothetical protein